MKRLQFLLLIFSASTSIAQNIVGTLAIKGNKKAANHIIDYGNGFHTIFFDDISLHYYRIDYNFSLEKSGSINLKDIGYKPRIIEIAGNRKDLLIYYSRADSANIWLLRVNTISGNLNRIETGIELTRSDKLLGNYSIGDTSIFYIKSKDQLPKGTIAIQGEKVESFNFNFDTQYSGYWEKSVEQFPQLSKTLVHKSYAASENLMHLGSVKHYFNHKKISISIDYGFSTLVAQYDRKLKSSSFYKADFNLETVGIPTGGIYGSILKGNYLYQGALFASGAVVQKADLKFEKTVYNQFFPYGYSNGTGSPVSNLNRGQKGSFSIETTEALNIHTTRPLRFLGINVITKGPFEHYSLSEYEPMKNEKDWINAENAISPTLSRRKNNAAFSFYALQSSATSHYAFLQHMQGMSSTFFCTTSNKGDKSPYLGKSKMAFASASEAYYKYALKGQIILYPTVAKINNQVYYCFYSNRDKKFIFATL
ncbi:MAG: hypothetical protein JXQ87_09840 [Bacteroidia bacterium]